VSAEAYGNWNKKEEFKAPTYPKSEEQTAALNQRLSQAFMFSALNPDELNIVLGAMQKVVKEPGDLVIKQGDDGDNLYVVETGTLSCFKTGKDGEEIPLKEYQPGEAFGELALLYNAPRAASIRAKTAADLWALDRRTFNHIVKDSAQQKREKYEEFLKKVSILENMDGYERSKLSDAIQE
jgi:cAMP-dependent protein kinase regulator